MRSFLLLIIGLTSLFCTFSCKSSQESHIRFEMEHDIKLYHQAIKYGDVGTAIAAMQSLLVWDSTKTNYYDTLSVLYYHSENYTQAVQSAQVVLDKDPDDNKLLQIISHSYQYLGRQDLAVPFYLRIAKKQPDPTVHYEIAACYFYMRDFNNVKTYVDRIMSDKRSDTTKVNISFNQGHDQQDVPVKAACYNLLGTMSANDHKNDEAMKDFNQARALFPGFELAKQNIGFIKQLKK